jgi:hypothetical protein
MLLATLARASMQAQISPKPLEFQRIPRLAIQALGVAVNDFEVSAVALPPLDIHEVGSGGAL